MALKKLLLYTCICGTVFGCRIVKHDEGREKLEAVCDKFMDDFSKSNIPKAYDLLKVNSVIGDSSINDIQAKSQSQLANLKAVYGKTLSYKLVANYSAKDVIEKRYYILRFEKYYLKFSFILYNNGRLWSITNFSYDEEVNDVLTNQ